MKLYIAADHAGFALKETLKASLSSEHELEDCGAFSLEASDDYPDMVRVCAEKVANNAGSFGIVIGASGQGEAIAANRIAGVRAAVYYGPVSKEQTDATGAELGLIESVRLHNDANVLALGARFLEEADALAAVQTFLATPFSGDERHLRRIQKLNA